MPHSFIFALSVVMSHHFVAGSLLSVGTLETCLDTGVPRLQSCAQRLVVTLTVQNGQNATESIQTHSVSSAMDSYGRTYDLLDTLEFTLHKTGIELHYPLVYQRQFNARPTEISLTQSPNGQSFNFLSNPCLDSPNADGSCGWVIDAQQNRIPSSNVGVASFQIECRQHWNITCVFILCRAFVVVVPSAIISLAIPSRDRLRLAIL